MRKFGFYVLFSLLFLLSFEIIGGGSVLLLAIIIAVAILTIIVMGSEYCK